MVAISPNMRKLAARLWRDDEVEQQRFLNTIETPPLEKRAAIILRGDAPEECEKVSAPFSAKVSVPFGGTLTGRSEAHAEGRVYLLDSSSVFAASVIEGAELADGCAVFDMCAAPGGKAIYAWRRFAPSVLVANEVIGKRLPSLISNFKRCGISPSIISSRDPSYWSSHFARCFDLVLVDAPCSGQSLLLKGEGEPGSFHPATINLNANRQRRIIANSIATVAPGGYLAYMTCTFSRDENEEIVEWVLKKFPHMSCIPVPHLEQFQSHLSSAPCYRLWPQQQLGAGSFAALFRSNEEASRAQIDVSSIPIAYRLDH